VADGWDAQPIEEQGGHADERRAADIEALQRHAASKPILIPACAFTRAIANITAEAVTAAPW
jgi:hypothetical protein